MKFLSLITLFFSINVFADTTLTRTYPAALDCQIKGDTGKRSYTLELVTEKIADDKRDLTFNVQFYKCAEVDGQMQVVISSPDEVLHHYILLNNELAQTNNTLVRVDIFMTDKFEATVGTSQLDLTTKSSTVQFSFNKNIENAFITARLKSNVEMPNGEVLKDVFQYVRGYVVNFK